MRLFTKSPAETPEARFWRWFQEHETRLFAFERDQKATFARLGKALDKVHGDLTFEFGPVHDGVREFVISAAGIKAAFPAVIALAAAAPPLPRWRITPFRPRRTVISDLKFGDKLLRSAQIAFVAEPDGDKVGLRIFIQGFAPTAEHHYEQMGYLMLDEAIGEYDMETKVGFVEFWPLREPRIPALRPLEELGHAIDQLSLGGDGRAPR
jgi:hypothetical protein